MKKTLSLGLDSRIEIRFNSDDLAFIDENAGRLGMTRSHLVRNLIDIGLDDLRLMRRFGLVSLIQFVRNNDIDPKRVMELALQK